jgi:hypothetical protein
VPEVGKSRQKLRACCLLQSTVRRGGVQARNLEFSWKLEFNISISASKCLRASLTTWDVEILRHQELCPGNLETVKAHAKDYLSPWELPVR